MVRTEAIAMRRRPVSLLLVFASAACVAATSTTASASRGSLDRGGARLHDRALSYFYVACGFSHRNDDDPIVSPGKPGVSHNHTYFGNNATDASSTFASLRTSGSTSCALRADTAAYWAPTLLVGRELVRPERATVFYVRRTFRPVEAFPAGLKMIAGDAMARRPQSEDVTYWSCGLRAPRSSTVPTCPPGEVLHLDVLFPNCWDGERLDSADHKSHMAYSAGGRCPSSHPVPVPALHLVIRYPVSGGASTQLASGGQLSGHADFINAWDQETLTALVSRYLNGFGYGFKGFGYRGRR
jgi:hypothetical protein